MSLTYEESVNRLSHGWSGNFGNVAAVLAVVFGKEEYKVRGDLDRAVTQRVATLASKPVALTVSQWQIYDQKGSGVCVRALNGALQKVVDALTKDPGLRVDLPVAKHLDPVLARYSALGTLDGEPRQAALAAISRRFPGRREVW